MAPMLSDEMSGYIEKLYEHSLELMERPETLDEAIQNFKLILNVDPDNSKVKYALSRALIIKGDNVTALKYLKDIDDLDLNEQNIEQILDIYRQNSVDMPDLKNRKIGNEVNVKKPTVTDSISTVGVMLVLILIVSFFSLNFLTEGYLIGWDSMSHVFKTWYTMESLLGRSNFDWCTYWYQGSPIMPMYAPLFYIISALIALIARMNALEASKLLIFITYPLSSISFYYFTRKDVYDLASFSASILYGLIPWHFTYVTILGNPTYSLCFIFLPPLFKYFGGKNHLDIIYSAIFLVLITISHQGTGFLLVYLLVWFSVFKGITYGEIRYSLKKLIYTLGVSAGILSFFWIPYLYYTSNSTSFEVPFELKYESIIQIVQKEHFMYLGLPLVFLLLCSTLIVMISMDLDGVIYTVMTSLSLIITFGYTNPKIQFFFPFNQFLGGGYRFNIFTSFTISMLVLVSVNAVPLLFDKLQETIKINTVKGSYVKVTIIFLIVLISVNIAISVSDFTNSPIPEDHHEIYSILLQDPNPGRVWWLPRGALQTSIPMYTSRGTPDGWYDQAASKYMYNLIHDLADSKINNETEDFVSNLSNLSVRFLIVETGELSEALSSIDDLDLCYQSQDLSMFYLSEIDEIVTITSPPQAQLVRILGLFVSFIVIVFLLLYIKYWRGNLESNLKLLKTRVTNVIKGL